MTSRLQWGLQPPGDVMVAWGARAIYDTRAGFRSVDLVPDRQSAVGEADAVAVLTRWFDASGRARLLAELSALDLQPGDSQYIEIHDKQPGGTFHLHASPKASHGYLYIVVWRDERQDDACDLCGSRLRVCIHADKHLCAACYRAEYGPRCSHGGECSSDDVYERYSLGIYAGKWCDEHWETSGYRKEGREGYDWMDAGEAYEPDDY